MMKVLLIEDEWHAAEALTDMIRTLRPQYQVVEVLSSIAEALVYFEKSPKLDLIVSDIHLSDGVSFALFKQIEVHVPIIFTTAFDAYAIQAFKVNSIDYLLKPIRIDELEVAIQKFEAQQQHHQQQVGPNLEALQAWLQNHVPTTKSFKQRFLVKNRQHYITIQTTEIAFFTAVNGLVFLTTFQNQRHLIDMTLDQLEAQLDNKRFFRANRQLIVQIDAIKQVATYFKGKLLLHLEPSPEGEQTVSQSRAADFKRWLDL
jgi:two-component system response regulator LytT